VFDHGALGKVAPPGGDVLVDLGVLGDAPITHLVGPVQAAGVPRDQSPEGIDERPEDRVSAGGRDPDVEGRAVLGPAVGVAQARL